MDEHEASYYMPKMTQDEIFEAEMAIQSASDFLTFKDLEDLCFKTWKLQRHWILDEFKGHIKQQMSDFEWLGEVSQI